MTCHRWVTQSACKGDVRTFASGCVTPPCQENSKTEEENCGSQLADVAEADLEHRRSPAEEAGSLQEVMSGALTSRSCLHGVTEALHAVGSF